jgi:lactam utilization protein B
MLARTSEPDGSLVSNRMPGAMLARKPNRRVELLDMTRTVESLTAEIGRIVAERQELRAAGASFDVLEKNRRRLAKAQSELSQLLIARYLPSSQTG